MKSYHERRRPVVYTPLGEALRVTAFFLLIVGASAFCGAVQNGWMP